MPSTIPKPTFKENSPPGPFEINEVYFHLYLHHTPSGPDRNQIEVVNRDLPKSFGSIVVKDWPLYDGFGPHAKLIARAQGLHIQAGMRIQNWYNSFTIVFEDTRFKGSSLQVMGPVIEKGQWAIVGGTGDLAMARGVIYKKNPEKIGRSTIIELDIHAFCKSQAIIVKRVLRGSDELGLDMGLRRGDMDVKGVNRIVKIGICHTKFINALSVDYERNGVEESTGWWGVYKDYAKNEITLRPHEYITSISGSEALRKNGSFGLATLKLVTNVSTYGPYGKRGYLPDFDEDCPFEITLPDSDEDYPFEITPGLGVGGRIIGFHATFRDCIYGIGVYFKEVSSVAAENARKEDDNYERERQMREREREEREREEREESELPFSLRHPRERGEIYKGAFSFSPRLPRERRDK